MSSSNNPPDVELRLTHAQATFVLENCDANRRLCLGLIMLVGEEDGSPEEKRERAEPYVRLNEQFGEIRKLLRDAGAREKEDYHDKK